MWFIGTLCGVQVLSLEYKSRVGTNSQFIINGVFLTPRATLAIPLVSRSLNMAPTRSALDRSSSRAEAIDATAALQLCASSVCRGGVVSTPMAQLGNMANNRNNYPHQHEDHPLRVRGCRGQQSRRRCRRNWQLKRRKRMLDESSTQVSSSGSSHFLAPTSIEGPPQGHHE